MLCLHYRSRIVRIYIGLFDLFEQAIRTFSVQARSVLDGVQSSTDRKALSSQSYGPATVTSSSRATLDTAERRIATEHLN